MPTRWPVAATVAMAAAVAHGDAWRPLGLVVGLLLLVLPELGLDGDRCLLSLGCAHVDVKVIRDVLLGLIWRDRERERGKERDRKGGVREMVSPSSSASDKTQCF